MVEKRWVAYDPNDYTPVLFYTKKAAEKWLLGYGKEDGIPEGFEDGEGWIAEIKARTATVPTGGKTEEGWGLYDVVLREVDMEESEGGGK